ncbi:4-hydroxy-3-methylbut-2-en-1-yl diphosphate synthase [Spirochaeta thermophila DSM 6578]|uniref:4-hydroxy-3-methylbut-2-en-1-yl diphosphate synthase (flavodoxin) n=1 Tax=Winmispira thermophila (strain ATCC 700085 / DSM 6578 / Z-1203) TaxID=869211 RepID=G0GEV3_WINT7|nr:flavodoxin-dependent (E)-4-hydroxy-3-methylbut-2-enyl-diphosphate synthase [Spirochaeta thermophila]AEJ61509.1 4-hydroxy-3-methylbut-2-en-1-yl diphosphate synthase [Spirochaeta thermophila DSM 6578]
MGDMSQREHFVPPEGGREVYTTKAVPVGSLVIGGGAPLVVQTMWKGPLTPETVSTIVEELERLSKMGCGLMRFAVPDMTAAEVVGRIAERSLMPVVADIHFDWRLALRVMDFPVAKVRINPGNIGARWKVEEVVRKAEEKGVAIRVGVNSGSLPKHLRHDPDVAAALVKAAEEELEILGSLGFERVIVSLKASDIETTVRANRVFAQRYEIPLHLGVTEAGPLIPGIVKSTAALVPLLSEGIGDTIRVSLSDSCEKEVLVGMEIARASGRRNTGVNLVSCPRCSRYSFDVMGFIERVYPYLLSIERPITVAVMGCVVNGPGEARYADLAITGTGRGIFLYRKGEKIREVAPDEAVDAFLEEIQHLL